MGISNAGAANHHATTTFGPLLSRRDLGKIVATVALLTLPAGCAKGRSAASVQPSPIPGLHEAIDAEYELSALNETHRVHAGWLLARDPLHEGPRSVQLDQSAITAPSPSLAERERDLAGRHLSQLSDDQPDWMRLALISMAASATLLANGITLVAPDAAPNPEVTVPSVTEAASILLSRLYQYNYLLPIAMAHIPAKDPRSTQATERLAQQITQTSSTRQQARSQGVELSPEVAYQTPTVPTTTAEAIVLWRSCEMDLVAAWAVAGAAGFVPARDCLAQIVESAAIAHSLGELIHMWPGWYRGSAH